MKTAYAITPEILEWLNYTLSPLEQSVFSHYCGIRHLVDIVRGAEEGETSKYAAMNAILDHNIEHKTGIVYEEVRDRSPAYIMSDIGEWVVYTDDKDASRILIDVSDDIMEAIKYAPSHISWIVLWLTGQDVALVCRSPYDSKLRLLEGEQHITDGEEKGTVRSPTLPPDIVASMRQLSREEVFRTTEWR